MIECGDLFRQAHRVPQGEQEDCRTNADPARPHGDRRGQQQGSGADGRDQGSTAWGRKVALRQPDTVKAQGFCLVGRRQHGVKRLPLCLAFVIVAIHHQSDIHVLRPLSTQAAVSCAALGQGLCDTQNP